MNDEADESERTASKRAEWVTPARTTLGRLDDATNATGSNTDTTNPQDA